MITLSLLLVYGAATAQESHPDSTDVFYKHLELEETVVTGLAGDTKMKEMPAPVSVVRPADLAARASGNIIHRRGHFQARHPRYGLQPRRCRQ